MLVARKLKLTKTEREYFSRCVKNKALALANPELHHLARKLSEGKLGKLVSFLHNHLVK